MLLYAWSAHPFRATQDIDLLGRGEVTAERLAAVFGELCAAEVVDDGLAFEPSTVRVGIIREDQEYGGFRVKLQARLTAARISADARRPSLPRCRPRSGRAFAEDPAKLKQWTGPSSSGRASRRKPPPFHIAEAARSGTRFERTWPAGS